MAKKSLCSKTIRFHRVPWSSIMWFLSVKVGIETKKKSKQMLDFWTSESKRKCSGVIKMLELTRKGYHSRYVIAWDKWGTFSVLMWVWCPRIASDCTLSIFVAVNAVYLWLLDMFMNLPHSKNEQRSAALRFNNSSPLLCCLRVICDRSLAKRINWKDRRAHKSVKCRVMPGS